jgi:hypothetical protein
MEREKVMADPYDRSSKWLIGHHGDALLRLGGAQGFRSWRPLQSEVVQPRQLPDGLLEVVFPDRPEPDLFLVEITTYPERRIEEQVLRGAQLVYLDRRALPEVLVLVLQPRGDFRLTGASEAASQHGWTHLRCNWRMVELWTLPAEQLLAANDVGLVPWVPLTRFDGPPEPVLEECRRRIDQQAPPDEQANLLAVTQVLAHLRYNNRQLLSIFGGSRAMIESPLVQELIAETKQRTTQQHILDNLEARFGPVPSEIAVKVRAITDEKKLSDFHRHAATCPDLESFRARLDA